MESDSGLYSFLLFSKGKGYPLFQPQPSDDLPDESKKTGVRIGDVGVVTPPGSFDPIFNILHGQGDRVVNRFGVPEHFVQLELGDYDIEWHDLRHPIGSDVSNTTIAKKRLGVEASVDGNVFLPVGAGAEVEVSTDSKRVAVLVLPDGASTWDLRNHLQLFKDYAEKHTQNWYKFVNGHLGRRIANGDLYLITGVTKSSSWSVAAVEQGSGDNRISLKLKAAQVATAGASYAWTWEERGSSNCHSGPRGPQSQMAWKNNQTVFLRGFKTYFRLPRPAMLPKALWIQDSNWSDIRWKGQVAPYSNSSARSGTASGISSTQTAGAGRSLSPSESAELPSDNVDFLDRVGYHPSRAINEHLLDCDPTATVAITHDDEWASVLTEDDHEMPTRYELIRRISNKFDIATTPSGAVYLRARSIGGVRASREQESSHVFSSLLRLNEMPETYEMPPPYEEIQKPSSGGEDTVFALLIGIDNYVAKNDLPPLRGAVNDARAFQQHLLDFHVPPSNILLIENERATRAAILSAFQSHFLKNENIPDGGEATIIFFFAGYGSLVDAPAAMNWRDLHVKVLCPVDERTTNDAGEYVHPIPDYVLGWLLWELAEKKGRNITVILDSCTSGGMGRDVGMPRAALSKSRPIPHAVDSHLWKGKTDTVWSYRMWSTSATSHVLLAACHEDETAREVKYKEGQNGRFTRSLIDLLRWAPLESITYEDLIDRLPRWSGQTPYCGGSGIKRPIFNGNYPKAARRSVRLWSSEDDPKPNSSKLFVADIGTVEGVVTGTEFSIYDKDNKFLCTFVAQSVLVHRSILVGRNRSPVDIPLSSRAVVSDWKDRSMLLRVYIPPDFPYTDPLFQLSRAVQPPRFVQAPSLEEAHIAVRIDADRDEVIIESRTPTMLKFQPEKRFPLEGKRSHLFDAIDGVAHFSYFLDRANDVDPIQGFALEMHRLKGEFPNRQPDMKVGENGNMVKDGAVRFVSEEGAKYGFTIRNVFSEALFPYLFYFDPETYTIQQWYSPEGRYAGAALQSGETLTIGMGSERAFEFMLEPGEVSSCGFLKLFVTREFIDLDWIRQTVSPFSPSFQGNGRRTTEKEEFDKMVTWDALTVTLTMIA
ncbi:hypothetical protein MVEN_00950400 [Mycena venus]|uniref:Peptidase C14 caspase domain-containing protein n=1 Tax=Mycena venus TaxID=2733690 RepID=A0A8H6YCG6_9AGAR|nr:hypothetical protein MVEN_00950400 [Mycena venus]